MVETAQHPLVDDLGRRIAAGEVAAGTRLVPEEIADGHGVSRSVVREALRVLEAKGMVWPRQRVGTRVLSPSSWDNLDPDVIRWRLSGPDRIAILDDLEELRVAVEPRAARLCCSRATSEDVAVLTELAATMRTCSTSRDLAGFTIADVAFHARLLNASGNAAFRRLAATFGALLHAREELGTLPHEISDRVLALHEEIAAAISRHDPDRAERAARSLVDGARAEVLDRLGRAGGDPDGVRPW